MATKARIQVVSVGDSGTFIVQGADATSTQVLAQALGRVEGLRVVKAWPRRKGGADFPAPCLCRSGYTLEESRKPLEQAMGKANRAALKLSSPTPTPHKGEVKK